MVDPSETDDSRSPLRFPTWDGPNYIDEGHWHECLGCQRRMACYRRHEGSYSYFVMARQCVHCG